MTDPTLRDALAKAMHNRHNPGEPWESTEDLPKMRAAYRADADAALSILSDALAQRDARIAELERMLDAVVNFNANKCGVWTKIDVTEADLREARAKLKEPHNG